MSNAVLLDTHILIWLGFGTLPASALACIELAGAEDGALVSPISAWEIGLLARPTSSQRERPQFLPDPLSWFDDLMQHPALAPTPFTSAIAVSASFLPGPLHRDPADRFMIATARVLNIPLLTCDEAILAYAAQGHLRAITC